MSNIAFDDTALTRIADVARTLSRLHAASRIRSVDDDQIDREFNAVCMSVWGYTTDDFSDELFSGADHAFLDSGICRIVKSRFRPGTRRRVPGPCGRRRL